MGRSDGAVTRDQFTARTLSNQEMITPEDFRTVVDAVEFVMGKKELPGHLFVTVVGGESIATGPNPSDYGFGLYMAGIQHIAIAGTRPDDWGYGDCEWRRQLQLTAIHEVLHYAQELEGTLENSAENEKSTELESLRLLQEMMNQGAACS